MPTDLPSSDDTESPDPMVGSGSPSVAEAGIGAYAKLGRCEGEMSDLEMMKAMLERAGIEYDVPGRDPVDPDLDFMWVFRKEVRIARGCSDDVKLTVDLAYLLFAFKSDGSLHDMKALERGFTGD